MRKENTINGYSLEICANSIASAKAADVGGATRIELCQSLELGGTTPSYGLIKSVMQHTNLGVYVLIRPRTGDFVYSSSELDEIRYDIALCQDLGCNGVVVGALDIEGHVDMDNMESLMRVAPDMQFIFHRAFDRCRDPFASLEQIIQLGCTRILTSGLRASAFEGRELLRELVDRAEGRIEIMPGAGVNTANIEEILNYTGAKAIHSSAKKILKSTMKYENPNFSEMNEDLWMTDQVIVEELVHILKKL